MGTLKEGQRGHRKCDVWTWEPLQARGELQYSEGKQCPAPHTGADMHTDMHTHRHAHTRGWLLYPKCCSILGLEDVDLFFKKKKPFKLLLLH